MIELVLAAELILGSIEVKDGCAGEQRATCVGLMQRIFKTTNPQTGEAGRRIQNLVYTAVPLGVVDTGDSLALIVRFDDENGTFHVNGGRFSAYYFAKNETTGPPASVSRDFIQIGSWGAAGWATLATANDGTPILIATGGGTWQGYSCSYVALGLVGPQGAKELGSFVESANTPAGTSFDASLVLPLSLERLEIRYRGKLKLANGPSRVIDRTVVYQMRNQKLVAVQSEMSNPC